MVSSVRELSYSSAMPFTVLLRLRDRGKNFDDMKKDAEFQYVTTRKEQAAAKKAQKEALNAAVGTSDGDDNNGGDNNNGEITE